MNEINKKDVLEYSEDELKLMSKNDLEILLKEAENKESLYNTKQSVNKLLMNSLYGALGQRYFNLFNEDIAAAITGNGRYFIQKLANYIEEKLQTMLPQNKKYIVYGDTDSVYYHIEPFMNLYQNKNPDLSINQYVDWADNFEKKVIQPCIKDCISDFANELNAYDKDVIGAEREIISDSAVFTAKKKYYARVRDSEGTRYPETDPYIKVMGLEIIKSSTPNWSKKKLKEAIPHILDKDETNLKNWINTIKQEFINVPLIDIAHSGGVSNLDFKLNDKGVPIGVRAALIHNKYIKDNKIEEKFSPINPGDKCKRLFLKEPNPFNSNIIAFTNDSFVNEVKDYIDFDTNFDKQFLSALKLMVNSLEYNLDKETQLLDDW